MTGSADFAAAVDQVERNYAGYGDRHRRGGAAIDALARELAAATRDATPAARVDALRRWLALFGDRHLRASEVDGAPSGAGIAAPPTLDFPAAGVAYLRVPSFELSCKPALDALLRAAHDRIAAADALVVDLRGNRGGGDATFGALLPLVYTRPVSRIGTDLWASPDNTAYMRAVVELREIPASMRAGLRRVVAQMEARPDSFVMLSGDAVVRLDLPRAAPRRVGVLIDRFTASAAEEFLLQARQSDRVVIFGRSNSAGVLDYSNVRTVALPSGEVELHYPTSRSRRLPARPVDGVGVPPDVRIPDEAGDEGDYVRRWLEAAGRTGLREAAESR